MLYFVGASEKPRGPGEPRMLRSDCPTATSARLGFSPQLEQIQMLYCNNVLPMQSCPRQNS